MCSKSYRWDSTMERSTKTRGRSLGFFLLAISACGPEASDDLDSDSNASDDEASSSSPVGDLPPKDDDFAFLEDFCGSFTARDSCLEANNQSPEGGWRCYDANTKMEVSCYCGWGEGFRIKDAVTCEAEPVVMGCKPVLWDLDLVCRSGEGEPPKCNHAISIGQSDAWVTVGHFSCLPLEAPDGTKTEACLLTGDTASNCDPCTEQLVMQLCQ